MAIGKYSLVRLISEDSVIEETQLPQNLKTEEIVEIAYQLKILREVFSAEVRRRVYDVQKFKTKSKYFGDNFEPKKK